MSAFTVFGFLYFLLFGRLPKEITFRSLTNIKSWKVILFIFDFLFLKTWESSRLICRLFNSDIFEIVKIDGLFGRLSFDEFVGTINLLVLISKLGKMNRSWLLTIVLILKGIFVIKTYLLAGIWVDVCLSRPKLWSSCRLSLRLNILKLIKIKTLILLLILNRKFHALIHAFFLNIRRFLNLSRKRIINNTCVIYFILSWGYFLERSLLTYWIKFLPADGRIELLPTSFKGIYLLSWDVLYFFFLFTYDLALCLKRILLITLCKAMVHLEVKNWRFLLWELAFVVVIKRI